MTTESGPSNLLLGAEARHHVVGYFEVSVHVLHVVAVFEGFEQFEEAPRGFLVYPRPILRRARRATRADSAAPKRCSSASRTVLKSSTAEVTTWLSSPLSASLAPASIAASS